MAGRPGSCCFLSRSGAWPRPQAGGCCPARPQSIFRDARPPSSRSWTAGGRGGGTSPHKRRTRRTCRPFQSAPTGAERSRNEVWKRVQRHRGRVRRLEAPRLEVRVRLGDREVSGGGTRRAVPRGSKPRRLHEDREGELRGRHRPSRRRHTMSGVFNRRFEERT